jgi:hypothetical protein
MPLQDKDFFAVALGEGASAREAWERTVAELPALSPGASLPRINVLRTVEGALRVGRRLFSLREGALARLSEAEQAAVAPQLDSVARVAFALQHVHSRFLVLQDDATLEELLQEGQELKVSALHWAELLERLGLASTQILAQIRVGTGHRDLVQDLQQLHPLLEAQWALVQSLQDKQQSAALRLSQAQLERMEPLAAQILARLNGKQEERQLQEVRQQLIACAALLEARYTAAVDAVAYHLRRSGQREEADALPSFYGLRNA